jgi:hypothetical protein
MQMSEIRDQWASTLQPPRRTSPSSSNTIQAPFHQRHDPQKRQHLPGSAFATNMTSSESSFDDAKMTSEPKSPPMARMPSPEASTRSSRESDCRARICEEQRQGERLNLDGEFLCQRERAIDEDPEVARQVDSGSRFKTMFSAARRSGCVFRWQSGPKKNRSKWMRSGSIAWPNAARDDRSRSG